MISLYYVLNSGYQRHGISWLNPSPGIDDLPPFDEITNTNVKKLSEISDLKSWKTSIQLVLRPQPH